MQSTTNFNIKDANYVYHKEAIYDTNENTVELKQADIPGARVLNRTTSYQCDHADFPGKQKDSEQNNNQLQAVKKRRTVAPSIKVGCKAYYSKREYSTGEVEVTYHWKHVNYDPFESELFISESRLPKEVKDWNHDAVDKYNDWKSIKRVLRLNDEELDNHDMFGSEYNFPPALLATYQDVQNVIIGGYEPPLLQTLPKPSQCRPLAQTFT